MTDSNSPKNGENKLLSAFAGLIGVLSIFLYFIGWVYRAAFFSFFQLQVTDLGFPIESFFLIPLQVFFKDPSRSFLSIFLLIIICLFISITLTLLDLEDKRSSQYLDISPDRDLWIKFLQKLNDFFNANLRKLKERIKFFFAIFRIFPKQIREELFVIILLLLIMYNYTSFQGFYDAKKFARNSTSPLPVVTLVTKSDLALGRNIEDIFKDPKLEGYRIFGDKDLFDSLIGEEINDDDRVWRLLVQSNGWIYIFPNLSDNAEWEERPRVLGIRESCNSDQLIILSPQTVKTTD